MTRCELRALLLFCCLLVPQVAQAQPRGWSLQRLYHFVGSTYSVRVIDFAAGTTIARIDLPAGVTATGGALTPDGRYYLLPTSLGVGRIRTDSLSFERFIGPGADVRQLAVSPLGTQVHVTGAFGRMVLDWETGAVLARECCAQTTVLFSPDGSIRFEIVDGWQAVPRAVTVTAFSASLGVRLWTMSQAGSLVRHAVSNRFLALELIDLTGSATMIWDAATGVEHGRLPVSTNGIAWHGDTLLAARRVEHHLHRLSAFELPDLVERSLAEQRIDPIESDSGSVGLEMSSDGRDAIWLVFISSLGISISRTEFRVVDPVTGEVRRAGAFGSQSQSALALEPASPCEIDVPSEVAAPPSGGVVQVSAAPARGCGFWSVLRPDVLNPGPHAGPATLLVATSPNTSASTATKVLRVGTREVSVVQAAAIPPAPDLRVSVQGSRLSLAWTPTAGAGFDAFEVLGAAAGGVLAPVATFAGDVREWTSPPLPAGSYTVALSARNEAGQGPSSPPTTVSVGVAELPAAPVNLAVDVVDDRVRLAWQPPTTGPAPSAFIVEAAPAGGARYVTVARSDALSFRASGVPVGAWQARVRAVTAGGAGPPSSPVSFTARPCAAAPGVPATPWVSAAGVSGTSRLVTLRWEPASGSVDDYVVEIGSAFGRLDIGRLQTKEDRLSTRVPQGTRVFVRLRAQNACGVSPASDQVLLLVP